MAEPDEKPPQPPTPAPLARVPGVVWPTLDVAIVLVAGLLCGLGKLTATEFAALSFSLVTARMWPRQPPPGGGGGGGPPALPPSAALTILSGLAAATMAGSRGALHLGRVVVAWAHGGPAEGPRATLHP